MTNSLSKTFFFFKFSKLKSFTGKHFKLFIKLIKNGMPCQSNITTLFVKWFGPFL